MGAEQQGITTTQDTTALDDILTLPREVLPHFKAGYAAYRAANPIESVPALVDDKKDGPPTPQYPRRQVIWGTLGLVVLHDTIKDRAITERMHYEETAKQHELGKPTSAAHDVPGMEPIDPTENLERMRRCIGELGHVSLNGIMTPQDFPPATLLGQLQRALERLELSLPGP